MPFTPLSNNHLRHTLSTKRFTTHKLILPRRSNSIERACNQQEHGSSDQTRGADDERQPLHQAHDAVDGRSHVVCAELAYEVVEFGAGWADAEEEGYFDEEDHEGGGSVGRFVLVLLLLDWSNGGLLLLGGLQAYCTEDDEERASEVEYVLCHS